MRRVGSAVLAVLTAACGKEIVVGSDLAADASEAKDAKGLKDATETRDAATDAADGGEDGGLEALVVPWTTGFENDNFADWSEPADGGYCYKAGAGTYTIVTTPVHSGNYAAAFTVDTSMSIPSQARCVRQGVLPTSGYYGAWYYVPPMAYVTSGAPWNLFHFQGADTTESLWDVSLINAPDGGIEPTVFDFKREASHDIAVTIPIATWFHLEVRFKRSTGNAGEFTVYLNGNSVLDLSGIETDDTQWGQWYVGSYATTLSPSPSVVYVDDVTIETSGP